MHGRHRWGLAVVLAASAVMSTAAPASAAADPGRELQSLVDMYQQAPTACADDPAQWCTPPGIVLQATTRTFSWSGATGLRERGVPSSKLQPTDSFWTASITKAFTAATALRLAEEGQLSLDDTLGEHLPASIVDSVNTHGGVNHGPQITVRQLLQHTGGIFDYAADPAFGFAVLTDPTRVWTPQDKIDWAVTNGAPYCAPGKCFGYSDTGYVLLGLIIEQASGTSLHQAIRSQVLTPLGLRNTYMAGLETPRVGAPPLSHYYFGTIDATGVDPSFDNFGGGGLISTSADLTTFIRGLFAGRLFEDPATLADMTTTTSVSPEYGLGLSKIVLDGEEAWGHSGAFGAFMYYWPETASSQAGTSNLASWFKPWSDGTQLTDFWQYLLMRDVQSHLKARGLT